MTKPLTCDKDWSRDMKLEFDHLKRRRVLVAHEIADESAIVADGLCAVSIRDARGLYDGRVTLEHTTRHGVYEADGHLIYKRFYVLTQSNRSLFAKLSLAQRG
jgi:hypothetical protein